MYCLKRNLLFIKQHKNADNNSIFITFPKVVKNIIIIKYDILQMASGRYWYQELTNYFK